MNFPPKVKLPRRRYFTAEERSMMTRKKTIVGRWIGRSGTLVLALISMSRGSRAQTSSIPPYLKDVVSHYAPIIIGETEDNQPKPQSADQLLPVDFDGDSSGRNNAANGDAGLVVLGMAKSTVYYSIVESGPTADKGYFYINFYFYHPRDMGISVNIAGLLYGQGNHEHDLEGVALIVQKSFSSPYGYLIAAYTEAHGALIPYVTQAFSPPGAAGHPSAGFIQFWNDANTQTSRPVVAIRSRKHGTYMAQDCTNPTNGQDNPGNHSYGMVLNSPATGTFTACIHGDSHAIVYVPVPLNAPPSSGMVADYLGNSIRQGTYRYQLAELVVSPIWELRNTFDKLEFLDDLFFPNGQSGYDFFRPSDPFPVQQGKGGANTPWAWRGGAGECVNAGVTDLCWYSFGQDNTVYTSSKINWPLSPATGQLVIDPNAEAALRFPTLASVTLPYRYNPYAATPPVCCSTYPLSGVVNGTTTIPVNTSSTWTAVAAGGAAPYTYKWTGVLTGSAQAVIGSLQASGSLFVKITDATGQTLNLTTYITATTTGGGPCGGSKC